MKSLLVVTLVFVAFVASSVQAQQESYELLWSYKTGGSDGGVSVSFNGSYIAVGAANRVYLLNHDGKLLWSYQTTFPVTDVSISANGGSIIAGDSDGGYPISDGWLYSLYTLNREGKLLSKVDATGVSSVSISPDESYLAMTYEHGLGWNDVVTLYGVGESKWLWDHGVGGKRLTTAVSVSANGSYVAVGGGRRLEEGGINLYNREGRLLWRYEIPDNHFISSDHSISISADGNYVVGGNDEGNKVYLLNRDGKLLWSYNTGSVKDVSISAEGNYIAAGRGNGVYLLNRDGKLLWSYNIGGSVSVASDGNYIVIGSEDKVYFFSKLRIVAQTALSKAKVAIQSKESKGFNFAEAEGLLSQAEQAFGAGDYKKAKELANQAKETAETIGKEVTAAQYAIGRAKEAISLEESKGFSIGEAEGLLSQAEQVFEAGDYKKARGLAEQSKIITDEAESAKNAINNARSAISQEKAKGFNVVDAKAMLLQAEGAFNSGDYNGAKNLAEQARALALDIDQDGVPNSEDFAPPIKNTYIYAGVFVFALSLILALKGVSFYIQRKRAKREDYEREKAEIIAMIEEAVNKRER